MPRARSKALSDAEIDLHWRVAVALVERRADIETDRPKAVIVANADPHPHLGMAGRWRHIDPHRARIDEGDHAPALGQPLAHLDVAFEQGEPAFRGVIGIARPHGRIGVTAHRATAAGVEAVL